jgi:hypothetical protein
VVQSPELGDQTFSGSQALSPIDDGDINFDDTLGGDLPFASETDQSFSGFDESIEIPEDDITLELGDIMPIDLDQLDEPIDLGELASFDSTEVLPPEQGQGADFNDDIDLNLTGGLFDQTNDFDSTEVLATDSFGKSIDLNMTDEFDERMKLDLSGELGDFEFDSTSIAFESLADSTGLNEAPTLSEEEDLDLDDELLADLTGELPEFETGAGEETADIFPADLQMEAETEQPGGGLSADGDSELPEFAFDETDFALEPGPASAPFRVDDTLGEDDHLELDDDLRATLTGDFPAADSDETANFLRDDLQAAAEAEQPGGGAPADTGAELPEFVFAETDFTLEPGAASAPSSDDDTLGEDDRLELDDDLRATLTGDFPAADSDETADFLRDDLQAAAEAEAEPDEFKFAEDEFKFAESEPALAPATARASFNDEDTLAESASFALDDELDLDLAEFDAGQQPQDDEALADELFATMDDELDLDLTELDSGQESGPAAQLEELEPETDEEIFTAGGAPSLGLNEIDVSDLLSAPEEEAHPEDEEIDLTSLLADDEETHDSDLDLLAEDMPKFELIDEDEDNDEGPPDLPR